jgi:hypothetical protein
MTPYPPKTDSQEFEVANPDPSPGRWNENVRNDAGADITVRVWGTDELDRSGPPTWKTDRGFVYMIADLVAASHGSLAEELPGVMAAHFGNPAQALVAARRIQTSILKFLACRPGQGFAAAVLIHLPASTYASDREFVQRALGQASPGQILLAEDVYGGLRNLPGAKFRAVPPLTSAPGDPRTNLTELIWMSPEHNPRLYAVSESAAEASGAGVYSEDNQPSIGATRIVDSPFRKLDSFPVRTGEAPIARSSELRTGDQRAMEAPSAAEVRSGTTEFAHSSTSNLLLDELNAKRPIVTRARVILSVAAIVVVGALVAVFYRAPTPGNPPAVSQQPAAPAGSPAETVAPASPSGTQAPEQTPPPMQAKAPSPKKPPKVEKNKDDAAGKSPPKEPVVQVGDFSARDIPVLLQMAQSALGSGKYDDAEREYKVILQLQPGNPDATQGLHKLSLIRNEKGR